MKSTYLVVAVLVCCACGGNVGAGGDAGIDGDSCVDIDMDGVTDCDGDCDDSDPTVYPGAVEVCGDGVDNACGQDPDPVTLCQGLGTFVSFEIGDDATGDGTQQNPVQTIGAGMANAATIGNGVAVFVAEGDYSEKVIMVEGTDLLGGHQCDSAQCTWARDPAQYDSVIVNQDHEGVVAGVTLTRATRLDGFRVMGLDSNGQRTTAITVDQGTPTLSNNRVFGGTQTQCGGWCVTTGIMAVGPSNGVAGVLITGNTIQGGDSVNGTFGVQLIFPKPVAEITQNTILGGTGSYTRAINAFGSAAGTTINNNRISAGSSTSQARATSFGLIISGDLTVDSNLINTDSATVGTCGPASGNAWCGGLESEGSTSIITNNVIFGMVATRSAAVFVGDGEIPFGEIVLNGNTLDGGGMANSLNLSESTAIACRTTQGTAARIGRIRNNILLGGQGLSRFGMYEDDQQNGRTCQPDVYENNDIFFATQVGTSDNAHRRWTGGGAQVLLPTVADVNMMPYAQANFAVDPGLDATYHLRAGSMCVDAGTSMEAPATDFDGDARPLGGGIDVGADESE